MTVSQELPRPPILLQERLTPTLEALWSGPVGSTALPVRPVGTTEIVDTIMRQVQAGGNYNCYIFTQYVQYLYLRIFQVDETTQLCRDQLRGIRETVISAWRTRRITDRGLNEFIRTRVADVPGDSRGSEFVEALRVLYNRFNPDAAYAGTEDIFDIVFAVYNDRPVSVKEVVPYRASLCQIDGYATPTHSLSSTARRVSLDTTLFFDMKDLYWKFIYSLNIPSHIESSGDFSFYIWLLASLALPLDPISLTTTMRRNLYDNSRAGVPFLNYLAMYLRQRTFNFGYTLSRLADPRRRVTQQLHRFCGVGATTIRDSQYARLLLEEIERLSDQKNENNLSNDERSMLFELLSVVNTSENLPFVREISYRASFEGSLEAAKVKPPVEDPAPDEGTPPTKKKKKKEENDDIGAFSDDKDPTADDTADNDQDPSKTGDDNIGQSDTPDQASEPRPVSKLLPLALPTETIDDHIYRLAVLRFVSHLDSAADPGVAPETLSFLKVWCGALLFIASSEATRSLMSQLKLTGKLKEFT